MTTLLGTALKNAAGKPVAETRTLRTADDFAGLSYYTLCCISDASAYANPMRGIPAGGETWTVDLDALGNFMAARRVVA